MGCASSTDRTSTNFRDSDDCNERLENRNGATPSFIQAAENRQDTKVTDNLNNSNQSLKGNDSSHKKSETLMPAGGPLTETTSQEEQITSCHLHAETQSPAPDAGHPDVTKIEETPSKSTGTDMEQMEENLNTQNAREKSTPNPILENTANEISQDKFDYAIRLANMIVNPDAILKYADKNVIKLRLSRSLPPSLSLFELLKKLTSLQMVDVSGCQMGPQAFRTIMLSLCHNKTITLLNIADNHTDTDSAACIGKMLKSNASLVHLDVSGNTLGTDYFSRCVGPSVATNKTLQILRCQSIGSTDMSVLAENLKTNNSIQELNISHNQLSNSQSVLSSLSDWIQSSSCPLKKLECKNCNLKDTDFKRIIEWLPVNHSLELLNIASNKVPNTGVLYDLILAAVGSHSLVSLNCDDTGVGQVGDWSPAEDKKPLEVSKLECLSMAKCNLTDHLLSSLCAAVLLKGLPQLRELNLSNNPMITGKAFQALHLVCQEGNRCSIEKLNWGLNSADDLPETFSSHPTPLLKYLNLRKSKISHAALGQLSPFCHNQGIETLVLDGIKLSGSEVLKTLMGPGDSCSLIALSLGGCLLTDKDLEPLVNSIKDGLKLTMLKVSSLTDKGVDQVVDALKQHESHPLALIDMSGNKVGTGGAKKLAEFVSQGPQKSKLHSLNLNSNAIATEGLTSLLSQVCGQGPSSLDSIHLCKQESTFDEDDMTAIFQQLASSLQFIVIEDGESYKSNTSDLSINNGSNLTVRLTGSGGYPGELGKLLDCEAISTDFQRTRLTYMPMQQAAELAAYLKGYSSPKCLMSGEDWSYIINAHRDAPSWLQLAEHRDRAVYISHLPASISVQKMEGFLEMEVDCSVEEVILMKDILTQKNNGFAWVLMSDEGSVEKAVEFTRAGNAVVFGQTFLMSRVNIQVDDTANSEAESKARKDMEKRLGERKKDAAAHQALINQSYQESQARHAYRLANPAYADGRIW